MNFKKFKQRLQASGQITCHDFNWKDIFAIYGFEWKRWWGKFCDGFYNLTNTSGCSSFGSCFDSEAENYFIKWLYYGDKKYIEPFYDWFSREMKRKLEERLEEPAEEKRKEPETKWGFIYVVKVGKHYKIGRAKNLENRVASYETANAGKVELVFSKEVKDYDKIEIELHQIFEENRVKGEWFKLSEKDIEMIKEYLNA